MPTTDPKTDPKTGWNPKLGIKAKRNSRAPFKSLLCNYEDNLRATIYTYKGKPCCFDPGEPAVIERIASLLEHGQLTPIKVWADARGRPHVADGFLRYFCFSVLADRKELDRIPGAGPEGYMEIQKVSRPKSPEDHLQRATANLHDNMAKPLTAVDLAFALRRLALPVGQPGGEHGLGLEDAGRRISAVTGQPLKPSAVKKYLQLVSLPPRVLGRVHRGEISMTAALAEASANGEGNTRGPRPTVKVPKLRAVLEQLPQGCVEAKALRWILDPESEQPPASIATALAAVEQAKAAAKSNGKSNGKTG